MQLSKNSTQKLLVISHDVVGSKMAGPGIRYYHLANALSQHIPTTFAVPSARQLQMKVWIFQ